MYLHDTFLQQPANNAEAGLLEPLRCTIGRPSCSVPHLAYCCVSFVSCGCPLRSGRVICCSSRIRRRRETYRLLVLHSGHSLHVGVHAPFLHFTERIPMLFAYVVVAPDVSIPMILPLREIDHCERARPVSVVDAREEVGARWNLQLHHVRAAWHI